MSSRRGGHRCAIRRARAVYRTRHGAVCHARGVVVGARRDLRGAAGAAVPGRCAAAARLSEPSGADGRAGVSACRIRVCRRCTSSTGRSFPTSRSTLVMPEMLKVTDDLFWQGAWCWSVTLLLPLVGAIVYHRVAFGIRSYWPLTAALGAYNALFLFGFTNFLRRSAPRCWRRRLAALAPAAPGAGDRRWRAGDRRDLLHALFGLVFLGVLIGCEEFSSFWRLRRTGGAAWVDLLRRAAMGGVAFAPPGRAGAAGAARSAYRPGVVSSAVAGDLLPYRAVHGT